MFEKPEMFDEVNIETSSVSLTANNGILSEIDILKYDLYCLNWQILLSFFLLLFLFVSNPNWQEQCVLIKRSILYVGTQLIIQDEMNDSSLTMKGRRR